MRGFGVRLKQILDEEWNSWAKSKKDFRKLGPVDIVIFDACGADIIEQCLPVASVFIWHVRGEKLHVNPKTLWLRLWFSIKYRRPRWSYYLAILQQLNPKVVITFIDNNTVFHQLSNHFTNSTFIAVQNGWRFPDVPNPLGFEGTFNSIMMSFGSNEIINWAKREVQFNQLVAAGSLKASLVQSHQNSSREDSHLITPRVPSVLYLSQFRPGLMNEQQINLTSDELKAQLCTFDDSNAQFDIDQFWKELGIPTYLANEATNIRWLVRVASDLQAKSNVALSFAVVRAGIENSPRSDSDLEFRYFKSITPLGDLKVLPKLNMFDSYSQVLDSEVVISSGSTLAQEALGMDKKVLLSQPVASPLQAPDFNIPWWLTNHRYEDFKQALIDLLAQTDAEYQSMYKREITYYSGQPTVKPTYELVRDEVISALANKATNSP